MLHFLPNKLLRKPCLDKGIQPFEYLAFWQGYQLFTTILACVKQVSCQGQERKPHHSLWPTAHSCTPQQAIPSPSMGSFWSHTHIGKHISNPTAYTDVPLSQCFCYAQSKCELGARTCSNPLGWGVALHAEGGEHGATAAAPVPGAATRPTARAWPAAGALPTWGQREILAGLYREQLYQ